MFYQKDDCPLLNKQRIKADGFSAKFEFDELVGKSTFYPTFAPDFHPPTFQTCLKYTVHS